MNIFSKIKNYFFESSAVKTSSRILKEVAGDNYSFGFRRGYDAGKTGRLSKYNIKGNVPFHEEIKGDFKTILGRARDLELNSSQVNAILNTIKRNVIRSGIQFQAKIKTSRRTLNESLNREIEGNFKNWCRKENCDVTGKLSFYDMQDLVARRIEIDGGLFIKKIWNPALRFPLQLQFLEIDLLDIYRSETLNNGNNIICGVEINNYRKPVAYYLNPEPTKPYDNYYAGYRTSVRIPTDEIIFIYDIIRIEQLHGISKLAVILPKLKDIMDIEENELAKEKIQTSYSAIITKTEFTSLAEGMSNEETNSEGQVEDLHEPGGVAYLAVGEDIKFPEKPKDSAYEKFIKVNTRSFAKADGWSAEQISGDLSEANYSSARAGGIEDEKNAEIWQKKIIDKFCQPIAEAFVDMLILTQKITAIDYFNNPYKYYDFLWLKPGTKWIDPKKEAEANDLLIRRGLLSRQDYYASLGKDFETEMEQIKFEKELLIKYGLEEMTIDNEKKETPNNADNDEE